MSKEYMVLIVDVPEGTIDVDDASAQVFMRFTEEPSDDYLERLAKQHKGKRVYCLMGASTWHQHGEPCNHNWRYLGTDRAGSHKGEDMHECCKCKAVEYRT